MTDADSVERVLDALAATAPAIRTAIAEHPASAGHAGDAEAGENPTGDLQKAADVRADEILLERFESVEGVGSYVSEERPDAIDVGSGLSVAVDPLDGSSNLPSNNLVGTVVGVYDAALPASGRDLVAAGYVLYGPVTTMTVAADGDVREYLVEDGQRHVRADGLTLPDESGVAGFGGRRDDWSPAFRDFADETLTTHSTRYGGSMVGDVNQVVHYGGVFAYPALVDAPEGKLRLQFEANPVAYLIEAAGGASLADEGSILDVDPEGLHQSVPTHVGSESLIDDLRERLTD